MHINGAKAEKHTKEKTLKKKHKGKREPYMQVDTEGSDATMVYSDSKKQVIEYYVVSFLMGLLFIGAVYWILMCAGKPEKTYNIIINEKAHKASLKYKEICPTHKGSFDILRDNEGNFYDLSGVLIPAKKIKFDDCKKYEKNR